MHVTDEAVTDTELEQQTYCVYISLHSTHQNEVFNDTRGTIRPFALHTLIFFRPYQSHNRTGIHLYHIGRRLRRQGEEAIGCSLENVLTG